MVEFPAELVKLQRRVLDAERAYQDRIGELYEHPVLRQARADGLLEEASRRLREVARVA